MDEYAYLFGCGHWEPVVPVPGGEPALVPGMTTTCQRCRNLRRVEHLVKLPPADDPRPEVTP